MDPKQLTESLDESEMGGRILDKTLSEGFGRSAPCPVGYIWDEEKKKCISIEKMKGNKMKNIEKIAKEIIAQAGTITFINFREMKDAYKVLEKELGNLVSRKSGDENKLYFKNYRSVQDALSILKKKKMDKFIKKVKK